MIVKPIALSGWPHAGGKKQKSCPVSPLQSGWRYSTMWCPADTPLTAVRSFVPPAAVSARDVSDEGLTVSKKKSRSEEHTSELQSPCNLVCRLLLEKKKN